MAPFKSSLARSAGKLFGVFREKHLSLRGATQSLRTPPPPGSWLADATLQATSVYTAPHTSSSGSRTYDLVEFIAVGAGGGPNGGSAGQGGFTIGRFYIPTAEDLLFAVGSTGADGEPGPGAGGAGWSASIGNGGSGYSAYSANAGLYGGSGGGDYTSGTPYVGLGNTPPTTPPQGNNSGQGSNNTAAGGGGAGAVGGNAPPTIGGVGGAGVQVAIAGPTATTFTGVGAKNPSNNQYQYFAGGAGGGGAGS